MRKIILMLSMLIFVTATITGCGKENKKTSEPAAKKYVITTVGSKWTMRATSGTNSEDTTTEVTQSSEGAYTTKTTSANSSDYDVAEFVQLSSGAWGNSKLTAYHNDIGESWLWSPPFMIFPAKTDVGTHEIQNTAITAGTHTIQAISDIQVNENEDVTVPAGTFKNALKITVTVKIGDTSMTSTLWIVDGIGIVKSVDSSETDEMTSYDIK